MTDRQKAVLEAMCIDRYDYFNAASRTLIDNEELAKKFCFRAQEIRQLCIDLINFDVDQRASTLKPYSHIGTNIAKDGETVLEVSNFELAQTITVLLNKYFDL